MKTLIGIIAAVVVLSSCGIVKQVPFEKKVFVYVDSVSLPYEDINNPGTYLYAKDTIKIEASYFENKDGHLKIKYAVINK